MNIEQLQHINKNDTSNSILNLLSKSREKSNETNLDSFKKFLINKSFPISSNEFQDFFKNLEAADVGYFAQNNRFIWKYSVSKICEQILLPNKKIDLSPVIEEKEVVPMPEVKKKRGRPPGSPNKSKIASPIGRTTHRVVSKEVVIAFTSSAGEVILFDLEDAERLSNQVKQTKERLAAKERLAM